MLLKNFIRPSRVAEILKKGGFTPGSGYRLMDCTSYFSPRINEQFMKKSYGKFEQLIATPSKQRSEYLEKHIPSAVHIDLEIATYPSVYQPYHVYPPELFQKYIRLLGVNRDEHLVLYGRSLLAGMMIPSRIAWLFRYYGHRAVSIIDGGLQAWESEGGPITTSIPTIQEGNWNANINNDCLVTYEQLIGPDGLLKKLNEIIFFDARLRDQYEGKVDTMLGPEVKGSRVPGTLCAPAAEMIENGRLKNDDDLRRWLEACGFKTNKFVVSHCLKGIQACLLNLMIEDLHPSTKCSVYFGSCLELQARNPSLISE